MDITNLNLIGVTKNIPNKQDNTSSVSFGSSELKNEEQLKSSQAVFAENVMVQYGISDLKLQTTDSSLKQTSQLETALFLDKFLNEDDKLKSAQLLLERYPELHWLTGDVNATPEWQNGLVSSSLSEVLFGQKHIEFDRTLVGIECLKSVLKNDYEGFSKCQKESVKITPECFGQLRDYTLSVLNTPKDVDALIAYTVINDLGKIKSFVAEVETLTGKETKDHDEALLIALKTMPEKIPSFSRLDLEYQENILNALDADFNLGQFVQAECLEGNLSGLKQVSKVAKDLYMAHMFYDVAGAAGHVNPNGSLVMTNPVCKGYMQAIDAIDKISEKSEKEVYNLFLSQKAQDLNLNMDTDEQRAVLKLAVMARATNQSDVNNIQNAFYSLDSDLQESLINGLSADGIEKPGVLLYYSPAFIQNAINAKSDNKIEMFKKVFATLAMIYDDNSDVESGIRTISLANIASAIKDLPELTADELFEQYK